uniref:Uncharacterized protein n=1 Tax=Oryza sativa subsp. japonica TaxID=39947 RepID=Q6ES18_ORYSJ|nr:hypothetical protein [Oryza sativa Japonica Group]
MSTASKDMSSLAAVLMLPPAKTSLCWRAFFSRPPAKMHFGWRDCDDRTSSRMKVGMQVEEVVLIQDVQDQHV